MSEWETKPDSGGAVQEFAERIASSLEAMLPLACEQAGECGQDATGKKVLLVALSGGPDSTALLIALNMVAARLSLSLRAVHVNHKLRGRESDDDQLFCQRLCQQQGIELLTSRVEDQPQSPSENDLREVRYQLISECARKCQTPFVVVAHTLDDQTETMLFRLFRGTSPGGLSGIQPITKTQYECVILRPALEITKHDCLRFLASLAVSAREDSSNTDTKYTRNFIRHDLIPIIDSRFPGFRDRLEHLRRISADENQFIDQIVREQSRGLEQGSHSRSETVWSRDLLIDMHAAIRRRVIVEAMIQRGVECTYERVQSILEMFERGRESGISLDTTWDVRIDAAGNIIWLDKSTAKVRALSAVRVRVPGMTILPAIAHALRVQELVDEKVAEKKFPGAQELEALVDLSAVERPLYLRQRREGDFIQPFGMKERVKLKKYLHTHERQSERHLNDLHGILLAYADEVLWIPGVGLSERLRVREQPSHRLTWVAIDQTTGLA